MWIKMRVNLRRQPKTLALARALNQHPPAIASLVPPGAVTGVTFSCLSRVTIASLLELWGAVQETICDANIVTQMTLDLVDEITEIPGFGMAMVDVGWITIVENGLRFNNFQEYNTPCKERGRPMTGAERTRKWRQGKSKNVTKVTIGDGRDVEQNRTDQSLPPISPKGDGRRKGREREVPSMDASERNAARRQYDELKTLLESKNGEE